MSKKSTLFAFLAVTGIAISTSACTGQTTTASPTPRTTSKSHALVDPLKVVSDSTSDFYVGQDAETLVHEKASGPLTLEIPRPSADFAQVRFFVSCTPESKVTVTMGKFSTGPCLSSSLASFGGIPIPAGDQPLTVSVKIPKGVNYWLVGVPTK